MTSPGNSTELSLKPRPMRLAAKDGRSPFGRSPMTAAIGCSRHNIDIRHIFLLRSYDESAIHKNSHILSMLQQTGSSVW